MFLLDDILIGAVKLYFKGIYKVTKFTVKTTAKGVKGIHNRIKQSNNLANLEQYSTNELKDLLILSEDPNEQKLIKSILRERVTK